MPFSHIRGIMFDMGSTLLEFENRPWDETTHDGLRIGYRQLRRRVPQVPEYETFASELMAIMDRLRQRSTDSLIERQSTDAPEQYFASKGYDNPKGLSHWFMDVFYTAVTDYMTMCEGADKTLGALKAAGYRTGMVSNTPYQRYQHEADLARFGLTDYLDFRIYSSEFGRRKPDPSIFLAGLEAMGLRNDEVLYVGDHYIWDVRGAQAAEIQPVLVHARHREYPDPIPKSVPVIHRLKELLKLLGIA